MAVVDEAWLRERGGLHDATLLGIRREDDAVVLHIEDEWWSLEGLPDYPGQSPVELVIEGGTLAATSPQNDWIIDVELANGGLLITFNDGERVAIAGKGVVARRVDPPDPPQ